MERPDVDAAPTNALAGKGLGCPVGFDERNELFESSMRARRAAVSSLRRQAMLLARQILLLVTFYKCVMSVMHAWTVGSVPFQVQG